MGAAPVGGDGRAMSTKVSVCGLIVIPGRESQGWECGCYWEEVTELDLGVALSFTRNRLRDESEANGYPNASFIAASFHPDYVPRCPGIEYADQPVNPSEEGDGDEPVYTVCGFYPDPWQTYSGLWSARTPRMAYLAAWEHEQNTSGRYLYVANVHEGVIPRLPVLGTDEPPAFGDPGCHTVAEMAEAIAALTEIG